MKTYIGDAVMVAPILPPLETAFREVKILTYGVVDQVLWSPARERVFIKPPKTRSLAEVLRQAKELRRQRFDAALLINHSFRSALTVFLAGIPVRVGHDKEMRRRLLTHPVAYDEAVFEAWSSYDLLKPFGIDAERERPRLPITEEERRKGREMLQGATVGLQPGARYVEKQIPPDVTAAIGKALQADGHRIALLGGPDEAESADRMAELLGGNVVSLVGKTNVRGTLGALSELELMIGSDTGLMHLAAASGCPTVTVFGPTPARKWGHDYPPHSVLQAPDGQMANTSADAVLEAARRKLGL